MTIIKPETGRVVHFRTQDMNPSTQSLAGTISHVFNDREINVGILDIDGYPMAYQNVVLLQEGDAPTDAFYWCQWMPYQIGQAKKYEELEAKVKG